MEKQNTRVIEESEANENHEPQSEYKGVCAVWDMRANSDVFTQRELLDWMKSNTKKFAFQLERGDKGYLHWQGRFSLIKKRNKPCLLKLFDEIGGRPNYLSPTATANHNDTFFYAMKEDTREGQLFCDQHHKKLIDDEQPYIPRQYRIDKLREWQQQVLDSANEFDSRGIDVIYDPPGNTGKSTLAGFAELKHGAVDLPTTNDFKEIVQTLCNICADTNNRAPRLVFLDMPRAQSKSQLHGFYSAIEQIKKGKLFDCRYHYKTYWIDSPRVWIFTNEVPDTSLLSRDRWRLWTIEKGKLEPIKQINAIKMPNLFLSALPDRESDSEEDNEIKMKRTYSMRLTN